MLKEAYGIKRLVIRTGKTDLRYGIDRLCSIVRTEYGFNPREEGVLYIFCGTRNDRLKALVFEGDGFVLLTKRLLKGMEFKWPRSQTQALEIPAETYMELMSGCEVESSLPYSGTGPGAETESNIDASLSGLSLSEEEAAFGKAAMPLEAGDGAYDDKIADLNGSGDVERVTQDRVPLDGSALEREENLAGDMAETGRSKTGKTIEDRQGSPSDAGSKASQVA